MMSNQVWYYKYHFTSIWSTTLCGWRSFCHHLWQRYLTLMKCLNIILQSFFFFFFHLKHQCFGWFSYLLLGIGVCCCCVMEATRIYLGMSGNLSEQVAELSTFWFTTLLIQLPLVAIILIVAFSLSQILEMVALSISSLLMAVQLCVSFTTLRNVSRLRQF